VSDRGARQPRLVLLCGLPGSGKSTLARRLAEALPAVRLSADDWLRALGLDFYDEEARDRIDTELWALAQDLLRLGVGVILESGFWTRAERDDKRARARALGAAVELRFLDLPIEELQRRLDRRAAAGGAAEPVVAPADLRAWALLLEPPDADELALFDDPRD
jgi:predicted kinase